jgi:hypothetical protein
MKKALSIIAALILASCGGGTTNQNVGTSDTTGGDGVHTVSTTDTAATQPATSDSKPANKPIVIEVAEKLAEKDLAGFSTNDLEKLEKYQPEHIFNFRPWDMGIDIHCFPYKDNGCAVVVILDLVCDYCGMASSKEYKLFSYKDGTITKINNLLPKPGIDDFYANAADFPKDTYNDLKKAIASTIWYSVTDDAKLLAEAEVVEWDGEDRILAKSLVPLIDNNESWHYPSTCYIWDGEKFVRAPESKPLTQDLKVFGIATEEISEYDKPLCEKIKKLQAKLPTAYADSVYVFTEDSGDGENGRYEKDCFFPYKNGGYLALMHINKCESGYCSVHDRTFVCKDGIVKPISRVLPEPDYSDFLKGKNPEQAQLLKRLTNDFTYDYYEGILSVDVVSDGLEEREQLADLEDYKTVNYKWNGEQFVKQE